MQGVYDLCNRIQAETGRAPNFDEVRALRAQFMAAAIARGKNHTPEPIAAVRAREVADEAVLEFYR